MGLKYRDLERLLQNKFHFSRAQHHEAGHKWYEPEISDGPTIRTMLSHGSGELSPNLEGKIARQLKVQSPFFREMMSCHKGFDDYCAQIRENPNLAFDQRF